VEDGGGGERGGDAKSVAACWNRGLVVEVGGRVESQVRADGRSIVTGVEVVKLLSLRDGCGEW
jgi:hypothetical protein